MNTQQKAFYTDKKFKKSYVFSKPNSNFSYKNFFIASTKYKCQQQGQPILKEHT